MSMDLTGAMIAALRYARNQGYLAGPVLGVDPPGIPAGKVMFPPHMNAVTNTSTLTVTAARYYIAPFWFSGRQTFSGALFKQGGTADNGKKVKIALYNTSASGAIGTLAKSFGEYTCDASATTKQMASAYTPDRGWKWGEFVCDGAGVFEGMTPVRYVSSVGGTLVNPIQAFMGSIIANAFLAENTYFQHCGDYVAGTYANFPEATSLAPTNTISSGSTQLFPAFGFYT
jgi:hypothetical protein